MSAPPASKELAETELWLLDLSRLPQTRVPGHKDLVEFLNLSDGSSWEPLLLAFLLVAEFLRAFDVDDTRRETIVADILVEQHIDVRVSVTGILRVAQGHVDG